MPSRTKDDSEAAFAGLTFTTLGASSVAHEDFEDTCEVMPNDLDTFVEVFPGGTQSGNICWQIRTEDADSLVLIVDAAFSLDGERFYLALP